MWRQITSAFLIIGKKLLVNIFSFVLYNREYTVHFVISLWFYFLLLLLFYKFWRLILIYMFRIFFVVLLYFGTVIVVTESFGGLKLFLSSDVNTWMLNFLQLHNFKLSNLSSCLRELTEFSNISLEYCVLRKWPLDVRVAQFSGISSSLETNLYRASAPLRNPLIRKEGCFHRLFLYFC